MSNRGGKLGKPVHMRGDQSLEMPKSNQDNPKVMLVTILAPIALFHEDHGGNAPDIPAALIAQKVKESVASIISELGLDSPGLVGGMMETQRTHPVLVVAMADKETLAWEKGSDALNKLMHTFQCATTDITQADCNIPGAGPTPPQRNEVAEMLDKLREMDDGEMVQTGDTLGDGKKKYDPPGYL